MRIRPAEAADADQLVELAEAVGTEDGDWLISTSAWRSVAEERRYLKAIRGHPDAAVFVSDDGGHIVGRLSLARDPHPASHHVADLGLMVAASHRRQGLGRALLQQAVAWGADSGIHRLELHVFSWNEPALALYESFGFEREGLRRQQYRRGAVYVDAVLMALLI